MSNYRRSSKIVKDRIIELHKKGYTNKQIALNTGYSTSRVSRLVRESNEKTNQ